LVATPQTTGGSVWNCTTTATPIGWVARAPRHASATSGPPAALCGSIHTPATALVCLTDSGVRATGRRRPGRRSLTASFRHRGALPLMAAGPSPPNATCTSPPTRRAIAALSARRGAPLRRRGLSPSARSEAALWECADGGSPWARRFRRAFIVGSTKTPKRWARLCSLSMLIFTTFSECSFGDAVEHRCHGVTGATPLGPEIDGPTFPSEAEHLALERCFRLLRLPWILRLWVY